METQTTDKLINDYVELKNRVKLFTKIIESQTEKASSAKPILEAITGSEIFLDLKKLSE